MRYMLMICAAIYGCDVVDEDVEQPLNEHAMASGHAAGEKIVNANMGRARIEPIDFEEMDAAFEQIEEPVIEPNVPDEPIVVVPPPIVEPTPPVKPPIDTEQDDDGTEDDKKERGKKEGKK